MINIKKDRHSEMSKEFNLKELELGTKYFGKDIFYFHEVDSTNKVAHIIAQNKAIEGTVIFAESQTEGRGRFSRPWFSPKGKGLWFTLILRPKIEPVKVSQITLVAAVAIHTAIFNITKLSTGIKWPNDILINDKKICGILSEGQLEEEFVDYVILGIGLNVNLESVELTAGIKSTATSLRIEKGEDIDRLLLFSELLSQLEEWYEIWLNKGFEPIRLAWKEKNITIGNQVNISSCNDAFNGKAIDIDKDGALKVQDEFGEIRSVISGDVSFN